MQMKSGRRVAGIRKLGEIFAVAKVWGNPSGRWLYLARSDWKKRERLLSHFWVYFYCIENGFNLASKWLQLPFLSFLRAHKPTHPRWTAPCKRLMNIKSLGGVAFSLTSSRWILWCKYKVIWYVFTGEDYVLPLCFYFSSVLSRRSQTQPWCCWKKHI